MNRFCWFFRFWNLLNLLTKIKFGQSFYILVHLDDEKESNFVGEDFSNHKVNGNFYRGNLLLTILV